MHYVHKKSRCGPEISTFRTKTLHFLGVIRLNWLAKIELRGPGANNKLFCHIFVIGKIVIGGRPCPPPIVYAYAPSEENKKRCSQIFREVSGVFQRSFKCLKNSAVLEPRTGQFLRT